MKNKTKGLIALGALLLSGLTVELSSALLVFVPHSDLNMDRLVIMLFVSFLIVLGLAIQGCMAIMEKPDV